MYASISDGSPDILKGQFLESYLADNVVYTDAQSKLSISSGLLFANPIPAEYSIPKAKMDAIIAQAVHEAAEKGVHGSNNTPFILAKIRELTAGGSVTSNRVLVEQNVERGTKVAVELAKLELREHPLLDR